MITAGRNPFELGSASDHLGTAASALRDSIDDLRRLNVGPSVLGMLTDAMTLCGNLAQQLDSATNIELARVNAMPEESVDDVLADLAGGSAKNPTEKCPACEGFGFLNVNDTGRPGMPSIKRCTTCHGGGVA